MVNITDKDLFNKLVLLAKGEIPADKWVSWSLENLDRLKKELPPRWFLRIKPKNSQGNNGATLISQNSCLEYLNSIGFDIKKSGIGYESLWRKDLDLVQQGVKDEDEVFRRNFEINFKYILSFYPKLFSILRKCLLANDVVKAGVKENDILETQSKLGIYLGNDLCTFFKNISVIKIEGFSIDFNKLSKCTYSGQNYLFLGDYWLDNDGDELLINLEIGSIHYRNIGSNSIVFLSPSFISFIENEAVAFINDN